MFRWMKDDKKKKKDKKEKDVPGLTKEDLKRLDEVRKSFNNFTENDSIDYERNSAHSSPYNRPHSISPSSLTKVPPPVPKKPKSSQIKTQNSPQSPTNTSTPSPQGSVSLTNEMIALIDQKMSSNPDYISKGPISFHSQKKREQSNIHPGENAGMGHYWKPSKCDTLPPVNPSKPPRARILNIARQPTGDFGFSLRRAVLIDPRSNDGSENKQTLIFAEPSALDHSNETGLLPGDRLLEVNDVSVENKSKEDVIELIRTSENLVRLKVHPVPELTELTMCAGYSESETDCAVNSRTLAKTEDQLEEDRSWLKADQVWLIHQAGFTQAQILNTEKPSEGKSRINIPSTGQELEVDDEDLEKANSPQYDRSMDLCSLRHLNESSILNTLRQRYISSLVYTFAGPSLISINSLHPLAIYSEKVMKLFKSYQPGNMPPHIYAIAHKAYNNIQTTRKNQSIVFLGRSGSGKTANFRHTLQYLAHIGGSSKNILTMDKMNAITTLLEAFGNCRTALNIDATRFIKLFAIDFDHSGQIISASIQIHMLEKARVSRRPEGEPNFHIFYYMLAGVDDQLRKELYLEDLSELCLFMSPLSKAEDVRKTKIYWNYTQAAMKTLGFQDKEMKALFQVLASIYHMGVAGATKTNMGRGQFVKPQSAQRAATLLGTSLEDLTKGVFPTDHKMATRIGGGDLENLESLQAMAAGLYGEVFSVLVSLINRCLAGSGRTANSIYLLDCPGLQNPATCGKTSGASLDDFCYNYCNERLNKLFFETCYTTQNQTYKQEKITWPLEEVSSCSPLANLLDNRSWDSKDHKGLLWLLDEDSLFSTPASDRCLSEKIFSYFSNREQQLWLQRGFYSHELLVQHCQGTNPVTYNLSGWSCREHPASRYASALLHDSNLEHVSQVFVASRGTNSSFVGDTASVLRSSSARRAQTISTAKRRSLPLQVKFVMDALWDLIYPTELHFVHCILPQHNAGLKIAPLTDDINIPLVRSQLRGAQILDVVRLFKQGYPEHLPFEIFRRRFGLLISPEQRCEMPSEHRGAVVKILKHLEFDSSIYRLGESQIFFRTGVLGDLEVKRNHKLNDLVIRIQAQCRAKLAKNKLNKYRVQDVAIRCIQRNVKKLKAIETWPWWRLLVKILPLLNVHKTEEELRMKTEELETLRTRVEKVECERTELQHLNGKLEAKVTELWAELGEEQAAGARTAAMLEAESSDRRRLEREILELQDKYAQIQEKTQKMQLDAYDYRIQRSETNGDFSEEEDDTMESIYKQKYERAMKELEITKRTLQQQHEEEMEQQFMIKKASDKKLCEALEDVDEERKVVSQWKRKANKLTAELQDLRLVLEEQMSRNAELEKRQRKFDMELNASQEELKKERHLRERIDREKEHIQAEKYSLEQELHSTRLDADLYLEKVSVLNKELEELTLSSRGEEEVTHLKRVKQELERKLADQEEELEDFAGQVQMLEQAKLRLEMSLENLRQETRRELSVKDEEVDELRASYSKKFKNIEAQLETEQEDRHQLVKQKHELERKLMEVPEPKDLGKEKRLKRELKKTKALLADAQMMAEHSKDGQSNKSQIRQLKNQVEDAEFAKNSAVKARQSIELELEDVQNQLDEVTRIKNESESKCLQLSRERSALISQAEEAEEEMAEIMKKYKNIVFQMQSDQKVMVSQEQTITELEQDKQHLKEQVSDLLQKLEQASSSPEDTHKVHQLEARLREMESRLEMEQMAHSRLEHQINKLKEQCERLREEGDSCRNKEMQGKDAVRKLQRQIRDLKDDLSLIQQKELEVNQKCHQLESKLEMSETDLQVTKNDLRLACQRIQDLQVALEDDLDSGTDVPDDSSDSESSGLDVSSSYNRYRHASVSSNASSVDIASRVETIKLEENTSSEV